MPHYEPTAYYPTNTSEIVGKVREEIFCDELLCSDFRWILERCLGKKERILTEMLIEGYQPQEIQQLMKLSPSAYSNLRSRAKRKILKNLRG